MRNKKYYPFERNHYFYGKLLTVRDFLDEQKYLNDKRRMQNFLTAGAGVVSGLSVLQIDEKTISLESGMALDYMGREIVVEESVTKKLNVIDGFESLNQMDCVYLCLAYQEEKKEKIPSVTGDSANEKENYNRIREGYRLFLTDTAAEESLLTLDFLKQEKKIIYHKNGIQITHLFPRFAKSGEKIECKVIIEKKNLPRIVEVDYHCSLTNLKNEEGMPELQIYYRDDDITAYKTIELTFVLTVDAVKNTKGYLKVVGGKGRILIGSVGCPLEESVEFVTEIEDRPIQERMIQAQWNRHFDDTMMMGAENPVYLAKMRLIKQEKEYSIESFLPLPFKQYVLSNAMLASLLSERTFVPEQTGRFPTVPEQNKPEPKKEKDAIFAQGMEIIEVDLRSKNKSYFSEEIAHGLGKGDVMMTVALEDGSDGAVFETKKNLFGNMEVFHASAFEPVLAKASTGIISYTERGTFRIGIRFYEDGQTPAVKVKWYAMKKTGQSAAAQTEVNQVEIRIEPNTVSLAPREKCKFETIVTGTDHKECRFHITDENGGQIDRNGVYDAPTEEGVYEIVAESVKYPNKKATAFVVVKER